MTKIIQQVFGYQGIHSKIETLYGLFKLGVVFSMFSIPWLLLNSIIKFDGRTFWLFGICTLLIYPNFVGFFAVLQLNNQGNIISLKKSIRIFIECWKMLFSKRLIPMLLTSLSIILIVFEFLLVMRVKNLNFMIIPMLILSMLIITTIAFFLFILSDKKNKDQKNMLIFHISLFLGWKNIILSVIVGLIIILWLSIGYQTPILNILIGNAILPYCLYRLMLKSIKRFN